MFWNKEMETMGRKQLEDIQLERLKWTLNRAYNNVPAYKAKLDGAGVTPDSIKSLKDIQKLPFTVKDDFRTEYPDGLFAVPRRDIVRVHASSGTTGKPTVVGYTKNDLKMWAEIMSRIITASEVTAEDTAQIAFGYGLFTGALGLHYGLENIGAAVIPMSSGNTEKQLMLMEDLGTTVLIATPSYAMYLSEAARERGIIDRLKLRVGLLGSESCTVEMRKRIEDNFNMMVTDNYGMSEIIGPGVSGECSLRNGLHIAEDHFYCEIIDPDTGEVLPEGSVGELVVTPLTKEALPVLRYRTRDITRITCEPCPCGRTHARMDKIMGRSDDMLIIKGVNVFPSQIESVLVGINHIGPHYLLTVRNEGYMDSLEVSVELTEGSLLERFSDLNRVQTTVCEKLRSVLGLEAKVTLVAPKTIERFQGKAKRVIDLRNC